MTLLKFKQQMRGRGRVAVVDSDSRIVNTFYGPTDSIVNKATAFVGTLPEVETGRYGIDVSIFCMACEDFHSEEAECLC